MKANHDSEVERVVSEEKNRHDGELKKCKELLHMAKKSAVSTSEALTGLQDEAKDWKLAFSKIDADLASKYHTKFPSYFALLRHFTNLALFWLVFRELSSFGAPGSKPRQEGSNPEGPRWSDQHGMGD